MAGNQHFYKTISKIPVPVKTKLIQSLVIFSIFFYGCDPSRKITRDKKKKDDLVTLNFDTLTVKPGPPEVYSPAATQLNDILHTSLNVRFDWEKRYLYGQATISIRPYFYPVKTLKLDARGMELKEVAMLGTVTVPAGGNAVQPISDGIIEAGLKPTIGHIPLKYDYKDNVITIELGREYNRTETYTIFIDYISKPDELVTVGSAAITSDKGLYFINPDGKGFDD